nr:hypothetical protein [Tanacetum cinerariifolium]
MTNAVPSPPTDPPNTLDGSRVWEIQKLVDGEVESSSSEFSGTMLLSDEDSDDRIEHRIHKENLERDDEEKKDDDDMTYEKKDDDDDHHDDQRAHLQRVIARMCRRQAIRMQHMKKTFVTNSYFQEILEKDSYAKHGYDAFRIRDHDDHPGDDVPPDGEKSAKSQKMSRSTKSAKGLIYLNIKEEKRVIDLVDIPKFCDATLEKVLKELKLKIFVTEFKMKTPLHGELDLNIMKACEREIMKRLKHRKRMRRWKSFVNGRPILQSRARQE